jgi:hypothetical protein
LIKLHSTDADGLFKSLKLLFRLVKFSAVSINNWHYKKDTLKIFFTNNPTEPFSGLCAFEWLEASRVYRAWRAFRTVRVRWGGTRQVYLLSPQLGQNANQSRFSAIGLNIAFDSSVGRAVDCSWLNLKQTSIGHWFESGSKELFDFGVKN